MGRRTKDIFSQFEHIRERMDEAYQRVIGAPGRRHFRVLIMEPPVDVYETEDEVVIVLEMAGIAEEELEVTIEGLEVRLAGDRKPLPARPGGGYSQLEIGAGPFLRELHLPAEVNAEAVRTVYRDGMLEIALPKASPTVGKQLKIVVR